MAISKKTGWVDSSGQFHTNETNAKRAELRLQLTKFIDGRLDLDSCDGEQATKRTVIDLLEQNALVLQLIYNEHFAEQAVDTLPLTSDNNGKHF